MPAAALFIENNVQSHRASINLSPVVLDALLFDCELWPTDDTAEDHAV
jgi:hypothetical protein